MRLKCKTKFTSKIVQRKVMFAETTELINSIALRVVFYVMKMGRQLYVGYVLQTQQTLRTVVASTCQYRPCPISNQFYWGLFFLCM